MIGVLANPDDHQVAQEFFELFKTPWEFASPGRHYQVLLIVGEHEIGATADLVVVYSERITPHDELQEVPGLQEQQAQRFLNFKIDRIPIYGGAITIENRPGAFLKDELSGRCGAYIQRNGDCSQARIGYHLFHEIRTLLTIGQPVANASIPTVELHIAVLRELILECGIPLVEIPPVPEDFQFVACLTHDVDHPSIRQHKWDHTALGFVYRATLGSLTKLFRGQISLSAVLENWLAALKLPFVYLGVAKDFWRDFADRYRELEREVGSTFFIIPYRNRPGITSGGSAPTFRASGYGASDIADVISELAADGHEIGLHGIDAWVDSAKGLEEVRELQRVAGTTPGGIRMHWLYFDQNSPKKLEEVGALYDSSCGYNDAIGYRAGTTQVHKPLSATHLLELPLHVMDTALFYPSRMELSRAQAASVLNQIQQNAVRFGGVVTVNWHDRSLAPERLWDAPYRDLLASMKSRGAWFATAGQAVNWFRKRRSATFEPNPASPGLIRVHVAAAHKNGLPLLKLRTYRRDFAAAKNSGISFAYEDVAVKESTESGISHSLKS
jgi:peptidoglycan/xylan/chitin deacetylase (PgdA/CDA1 family)